MNIAYKLSCCINSVQLSSSEMPRFSLVDSHIFNRIRPCTELRVERASSLNHPSKPVDGISCNGIVTQPRKSSWELCLADWHTCLKKRPNPRTPLTSFSLLTASRTELSSSWSQMSKCRESLLSSISLENNDFCFATSLSQRNCSCRTPCWGLRLFCMSLMLLSISSMFTR